MRIFLLISLLSNLIVFSGCSTIFGEYDYSVAVKNIGTKKIWVYDFKIYKSDSNDNAKVGTGILNPEGESSSFPYLKKPYSSVWIQWRFMKGNEPYGKSYGKTVYINLPKEFDKEHGREITFYINPDKEDVTVSYGIRTDFNEDKEINSDGSRFKLPKENKQLGNQKQ